MLASAITHQLCKRRQKAKEAAAHLLQFLNVAGDKHHASAGRRYHRHRALTPAHLLNQSYLLKSSGFSCTALHSRKQASFDGIRWITLKKGGTYCKFWNPLDGRSKDGSLSQPMSFERRGRTRRGEKVGGWRPRRHFRRVFWLAGSPSRGFSYGGVAVAAKTRSRLRFVGILGPILSETRRARLWVVWRVVRRTRIDFGTVSPPAGLGETW